MGVSASCHSDIQNDLVSAIGEGDLHHVRILLTQKPKLVNAILSDKGFSPLHYAASLGQPEVVSLLLAKGAPVDVLNKMKQTPLMLACKNGRVACIEQLIQSGANILTFDSTHERTCLHYAAKGGHLQCLEKILEAARSPLVSQTWGFDRFINVRDGTGATALHLAASSCQSILVRMFLTNGALVCATTTKTRSNSLAFGSAPLHFAARGGSVECVKELLAWGADRLQRNSRGYTPFFIAMKYRNTACAALLNPLAAEPLVWPSPWKFMSNLEPGAKALLEAALARANDAWEKRIFSTSLLNEEETESCCTEVNGEESEVCCICFERVCTIEVLSCGHQMCARCTLALCCHNKPNPLTNCSLALSCPFCRCNIEQLRQVQPMQVERATPKKHEGEKNGDDYDACDIKTEGQVPGKALEKKHEHENEEDAEKDEDRDLSMELRAASNRSKKGLDVGSSGGAGGFMGLVSKGSFRLISSAWGSSRVMDIDWENENPQEQNNQFVA